VLRVERRAGTVFDVRVPEFQTRRVNLTFRYVPDEHVLPFARLSRPAREAVRGYVAELARGSAFFARELESEAAASRT